MTLIRRRREANPTDAYQAYARSARKQRAWAAENPGNVAIREEVAAALEDVAAAELSGSGAILDVGCGGGWWLERLAERGVAPRRLHGIDLLAERVTVARRRVAGADIRTGDAAALPYAPGSFALVTLLTVLSSAGGPERAEEALREVLRVTAPGGLIAIWEPRVRNPWNRSTLLVDRPRIGAILGEVEARPLTLLPALARRLGPLTGALYPRLVRLHALRTHALVLHRV